MSTHGGRNVDDSYEDEAGFGEAEGAGNNFKVGSSPGKFMGSSPCSGPVPTRMAGALVLAGKIAQRSKRGESILHCRFCFLPRLGKKLRSISLIS